MANRVCEKCIHYDVCLLHEDNFIADVAKNGFCGKFKNKADVVEVKRGEWKLHPDGSGTCSYCNRTQKSVWDFDNAQNFCGHCGADMRGDEK